MRETRSRGSLSSQRSQREKNMCLLAGEALQSVSSPQAHNLPKALSKGFPEKKATKPGSQEGTGACVSHYFSQFNAAQLSVTQRVWR